MENKAKILKMFTGIAAIGGVIDLCKICKKAHQAYKRKCFELQVAGSIIEVQRDLIEDLLEENKKLKKKTKTESK